MSTVALVIPVPIPPFLLALPLRKLVLISMPLRRAALALFALVPDVARAYSYDPYESGSCPYESCAFDVFDGDGACRLDESSASCEYIMHARAELWSMRG